MLQLLVMVLLAELPEESTAFAVKLNVPELVGVPVIAPVEAFRTRPAGKEPELIEKVYGETPPPATRLEL